MGQFLNSREPYDKYRTVILELKVDHTPEEAIAQIKEETCRPFGKHRWNSRQPSDS